jgi:hypothetical protein
LPAAGAGALQLCLVVDEPGVESLMIHRQEGAVSEAQHELASHGPDPRKLRAQTIVALGFDRQRAE